MVLGGGLQPRGRQLLWTLNREGSAAVAGGCKTNKQTNNYICNRIDAVSLLHRERGVAACLARGL